MDAHSVFVSYGTESSNSGSRYHKKKNSKRQRVIVGNDANDGDNDFENNSEDDESVVTATFGSFGTTQSIATFSIS